MESGKVLYQLDVSTQVTQVTQQRIDKTKVDTKQVFCEWASAKDPKSGRIYYYNIRTKETIWNKVSQSFSHGLIVLAYFDSPYMLSLLHDLHVYNSHWFLLHLQKKGTKC